MDILHENKIDILNFCDGRSIFNINKINKCYYNLTNKYLYNKYNLIIKIAKKKLKETYIDSFNVIDLILNEDITTEVYVFYKLILNYMIDTKFNECEDNMYSIEYNVFLNDLQCRKRNLKSVIIINRYLGMGWFYGIYNIYGTNKYFLSYQGGSNDWDRVDNFKKLNEYKIEDLELFNLEDALSKMFSNVDFVSNSN
tara:strand:+ start:3583 stop:4173 length:591 start_codon:yes stop_codon:yes gene_type:complete